MSSVDEKLDEIISLLKQQNSSSSSSIDDKLEMAKEYMMKNYNIKWLNDNIEEDIYEVIIFVIKKFIL